MYPSFTPSDSLIDVTIHSLAGLGDGVADHNGKPLFVPKSCVGDQLHVRILKQTASETRGEIAEILSPGPDRIDAPCPYYADCGGCTLQHLSPDAYRGYKYKRLESAVRQSGFSFDNPSIAFLDASSRRRVEFTIAQKENGVSLAFHRLRSHTLIPIDQCLVLEPTLQAALPAITQALSALSFRHTLSLLSLTATDSGIDAVLGLGVWEKRLTDDLLALAETLDLARLSVTDQNGPPRILSERRPVTIRLGAYDIAFPPYAFLQAAQKGQELMVGMIQEATQGARNVADLFCGIGTYSFPISAHARVHAIEIDASMVEHMRMNIARHRLGGTITASARDLFRTPLTASELNRFDTVIINPPRAGAKNQCEMLAASRVPTVVMVSCNPASWTRDAKILKNAGFSLKSLHGIDQFVYNPHFEIVSVFTRK